eukprot:298474-Amphidinium_carterae.1
MEKAPSCFCVGRWHDVAEQSCNAPTRMRFLGRSLRSIAVDDSGVHPHLSSKSDGLRNCVFAAMQP